MITLLVRSILVTIVLTVAAPIAAVICGVQPPPLEPGASGAVSPGALLVWGLLSSAAIATVLVGLAAQARVRGMTLVAGLFAVAFGIGHFAGLIEGYAFDVLAGPMTMRLLAMSALTSLAACATAAWLTQRKGGGAGPGDAPARWRPDSLQLAIVAVLYVGFYFAAGTLVWPFIEAFYATRAIPSQSAIAALQLLVRGPLFGIVLAWLVASTAGSRLSRALWAGAALSLVGGVAPLLIPNPFFPDAVRWAHLAEVTVSNFLFGMLAGWILTRGAAEGGASEVGNRNSEVRRAAF